MAKLAEEEELERILCERVQAILQEKPHDPAELKRAVEALDRWLLGYRAEPQSALKKRPCECA